MALTLVNFKMVCSAEMENLFGKTIRFTKEVLKTARWTVKVYFSFQMDKFSEEFGNKVSTLSLSI